VSSEPKIHLRAELGSRDTLCGLLADPGGPRVANDPAEVTCRSCAKNHGDIGRLSRAPEAVRLTDSQRFQVDEARDLLDRWDRERFAEDGYGAERTLADQVRNLLAIVDHLAAARAGEE
jgi:hypothetical protein